MEITVLPHALPIENRSGMQVYHYRNGSDIQRTKVSLTKHTFSFLRAGTKEVLGGDQSIKIGPQHFLLMKAGNCLMAEKIPRPAALYQSMLVFFPTEMILRFLEKHQLYASPKSEAEAKAFHVFPYDPFIDHFVASLEQILALSPSLQAHLLSPKFEEIMLYLTHQHGADFLNLMIQQADNQVARLASIVENNRYQKLSLQELAFLAHMSVSTFKREFVKIYQKPPIKWFHEERLAHIARLLVSQQKRPVDLYEEAGYENFSNFVQAFKKRYGLTPRQYQLREQIEPF